MIYNRTSKSICEDLQYGGKYLGFLYNSFIGRILLKLIINPIFSKICGKYNNMAISKKKIDRFIEKYNIDINEYEEKSMALLMNFLLERKGKHPMIKEKMLLFHQLIQN